MLTLADYLSRENKVKVFWDDDSMLETARSRFGLSLEGVTIVPNVFKYGLAQKLYATSKYDLIVYLSDGSIPASAARRNILHFQVPIGKTRSNPVSSRLYQAVVCNSAFTRQYLDPSLAKQASVIYPPVDLAEFKTSRKAKTVLTVGRFDSVYQAKKQEILIECWKKAAGQSWLEGWKFIIAGGLVRTDMVFFRRLEKLAHGFEIKLMPNVGFPELKRLYSEATIYWHAAGYGEKSPINMEHFGISTVEAIASGCVPVVYKGGGLPEIVESGLNGYLWTDPRELISVTAGIIRNIRNGEPQIRNSAEDVMRFGRDRFETEFRNLILRITS